MQKPLFKREAFLHNKVLFSQKVISENPVRESERDFGAADRTWTGTESPPRDFKSLVSAYSTTAACVHWEHLNIIYYLCHFVKRFN